jgi:hypothetical protein
MAILMSCERIYFNEPQSAQSTLRAEGKGFTIDLGVFGEGKKVFCHS